MPPTDNSARCQALATEIKANEDMLERQTADQQQAADRVAQLRDFVASVNEDLDEEDALQARLNEDIARLEAEIELQEQLGGPTGELRARLADAERELEGSEEKEQTYKDLAKAIVDRDLPAAHTDLDVASKHVGDTMARIAHARRESERLGCGSVPHPDHAPQAGVP